MYAKVSQKGQITIPKKIRERLCLGKDSGVLFVIEDDEVILKGVPAGSAENLAGSLRKYAEKYVPLDEIRNKIQKDIAREANADE